MVQFVTGIGHLHLADNAAIGGGVGRNIHNRQRVMPAAVLRISMTTKACVSGGACMAIFGDG
jgi:hypothetical protein